MSSLLASSVISAHSTTSFRILTNKTRLNIRSAIKRSESFDQNYVGELYISKLVINASVAHGGGGESPA